MRCAIAFYSVLPPNKGLQLTAYAVAHLGVYTHDTTSGIEQPAVTSAAAEHPVR